jgi:GR25 family glycosyltransferase involved in LPS biosynthesis
MNILTLENGKIVLPMCINLERSKDRRSYVQEVTSQINFPINFVKAVDKNLLIDTNTGQPIETERVVCGANDIIYGVTKEVEIRVQDPVYEHNTYKYCPPRKHCKIYKPYVHSLYLGALGCSLSHLECIRIFFNSSADYALILEDDVSFYRLNYEDILGDVCSNEFDICIVGTSPQHEYFPDQNGFSNNLVYETDKHQWYSGASAYLITRNFAEKIFPFTFVSCAADEFFGYAQLEMGAKILSLKTPIFGLSYHCKASTNTPMNT